MTYMILSKRLALYSVHLVLKWSVYFLPDFELHVIAFFLLSLATNLVIFVPENSPDLTLFMTGYISVVSKGLY